MKKTNASGRLQHPTAITRRPFLHSRKHRQFRLLLEFMPALTLVAILTTLVLYLAGPFAGVLVPQQTTQTAVFNKTVSLAYANDPVQELLMNRSLDYPNPALSTILVEGATIAAASEAAPTETPGLAPAETAKVFDANGIPQEWLPVSAFTPDQTVCYVRVNKANIRNLPNTSSDIVAAAAIGDQVTRLGYGLDWSQVATAGGQTGFVLTSLITTEVVAKPTPTPSLSPTPKPTPRPTAAPTVAVPAGTSVGSLTDAQQQAIVKLAKSCLGVKYVYGSESPSAGFDCSGLTLYIYKTLFSITLPRSAYSQSSAGTAVSRANIQIGDIICFDWDGGDGRCDHVGIYIGGGEYIHAAHSKGSVVQSTLKSTNPVVSIRRIIK